MARLPPASPRRPGRDRRAGGALVAVLATFVLLSLLSVGFLKLSEVHGLEVARRHLAQQAFWVAEAGVHGTAGRLRADASYRAAPTPLSGSLGQGQFAVSVTKSGDDYSIVSTGTQGQVQRVVRLDLTATEIPWLAAFADYALFADNGDLTLGANVVGSGSLYVNGDVTMDGSTAVLDGHVLATGTINDNGASYTPGTIPSPAPALPALDSTYFDQKILEARNTPDYLGDYSTTFLDLGGGTFRVKGSVTVDGTLVGPGTLVADGAMTMKASSTIGDHVELIAAQALAVESYAVVEPQSTLYSAQEIAIQHDGSFQAGSAVVTPGTVVIDQGTLFNGVVYAGDTITLQNQVQVHGAAVTAKGISVAADSVVTHDFGVFPENVPQGIETAPPGGRAKLALGTWREVR